MNKVIVIIFLVFSSLFVRAQTTSGSHAKGLKAIFSEPTLLAYQENAKTKVEDFYQYLQLLTDASRSKELRKEVKLNIIALFKNDEVLLPDLKSDDLGVVKLQLFLNALETGPPLKFELGSMSSQQIELNCWNISYSLKIIYGDKKRMLNLVQRIYLSKNIKAFGANSKYVWQVFLGEINNE